KGAREKECRIGLIDRARIVKRAVQRELGSAREIDLAAIARVLTQKRDRAAVFALDRARVFKLRWPDIEPVRIGAVDQDEALVNQLRSAGDDASKHAALSAHYRGWP